MLADSGSHVKQHAISGYYKNVLYAFQLFLFCFQLKLLTFIICFVFVMAADGGGVVATRSMHEEGGSTSETGRILVHEIVPQ